MPFAVIRVPRCTGSAAASATSSRRWLRRPMDDAARCVGAGQCFQWEQAWLRPVQPPECVINPIVEAGREAADAKHRRVGAFSPLRCVAQIWDYGSKLRFKVFDTNDEGVDETPKIIARDVRDERLLEQVIQAARVRIEHKGFLLN